MGHVHRDGRSIPQGLGADNRDALQNAGWDALNSVYERRAAPCRRGMTPDDWVELLGLPPQRVEAMRALAGGVTATELRRARPSDEAFVALLAGTRHENPQVRWWSVQLLDHLPDPRAIAALAERLDPPERRSRARMRHMQAGMGRSV